MHFQGRWALVSVLDPKFYLTSFFLHQERNESTRSLFFICCWSFPLPKSPVTFPILELKSFMCDSFLFYKIKLQILTLTICVLIFLYRSQQASIQPIVQSHDPINVCTLFRCAIIRFWNLGDIVLMLMFEYELSSHLCACDIIKQRKKTKISMLKS
jgi:hypothetical protein